MKEFTGILLMLLLLCGAALAGSIWTTAKRRARKWKHS